MKETFSAMSPSTNLVEPSQTSLPNELLSKNSNKDRFNLIHESFISRLDSDFIEYYNSTATLKPATHQVPLSEIRADPKKWAGSWCKDFSNEARVKNFTIASKDKYEVNVRTYHPDPELFGPGPYGIHVNYHGGGWTFGDLTSDAEFCMTVRDTVGIIVIDVEYRLCPENKYEKSIEDAWAVLSWVHSHPTELNCRANSISVGGISAGGQLSCVMQHMARDEGIRLKLAILSVPVTETMSFWKTPFDSSFPSYLQNQNAPCFNWERIKFFIKQAPAEDQINLPILWHSPLHAPNFKDLCDTFIVTADCDPLRDEGEAYGMKIVANGGKVTFRRYMGVPHPFMHYTWLEKGKLYNKDTTQILKLAHNVKVGEAEVDS